MEAISSDEVMRVASLAKLHLSPHEVDLFSHQLAQIVAMIQTLNELDTSQVQPMEHVADLNNVMVADLPSPGLNREAALGNAPKRDEACFLVPAVLATGGRSS